MTTATIKLHLFPKAGCDIVDITEQVKAAVQDHGVQQGAVQVFSPHTTAAIRINENDPGLLRDIRQNILRSLPTDINYEHNKIDPRQNARAHLASLMYGASETVPIADGQLGLGQWQSIFFIDFDGGRVEGRDVIVNILAA